ncbi:hypothetical protein DF186_16630, partial [Enterococcus hirae]
HPIQLTNKLTIHITNQPIHSKFNKKINNKHFHKFLEIFKKLKINIPLTETIKQITLYYKFLKNLINKKKN